MTDTHSGYTHNALVRARDTAYMSGTGQEDEMSQSRPTNFLDDIFGAGADEAAAAAEKAEAERRAQQIAEDEALATEVTQAIGIMTTCALLDHLIPGDHDPDNERATLAWLARVAQSNHMTIRQCIRGMTGDRFVWSE